MKADSFPKYLIGLVVVILLRLLPHPPNVEPITATLMPFARRWGVVAGVAFGVLAVLSYDILTGTIGVWSLFTAGAYALLGLSAGLYFARIKSASRLHYIGFAVVGTLLYDVVTGLTVGPLFFGQTFSSALLGQIPFTLWHLAGNVVLAAVVSPLIERFVVTNPALNWSRLHNYFSHGEQRI
jgi:hypothetical protein